MIDNNGGKAILEERDTGGLSVATRRSVINYLADYAISLYGHEVPRAKLVRLSEAALDIFPSLNLGTPENKNIVSEIHSRDESK